jgi:hypothetical protein
MRKRVLSEKLESVRFTVARVSRPIAVFRFVDVEILDSMEGLDVEILDSMEGLDAKILDSMEGLDVKISEQIL